MAQNDVSVWPKWKIALAVGAPVAVGIAGYLYYRKRYSKVQTVADKPTKPPVDDPEKATEKQQPPEKELTTLEKAQANKNKGNKFFKAGKFELAITCYTDAISICPTDQRGELATFYQNRAAAYEQLKQHGNVISDCTQALEYNQKYTKAMFRRAKACEQLGDLTQCLEDVTAVCIQEGFQNAQSLQMADRVLKDLGKNKAKEAYMKRSPVMPSDNFIISYFSAFANDPMQEPLPIQEEDDIIMMEEMEKIENESSEKELNDEERNKPKIEGQHTSPFIKAKKQFENGEYNQIIELCTDEINTGDSPYSSLALLARATFYLLKGQGDEALCDFNRLLAIESTSVRIRTNALIKRGSLQMQEGNEMEALNNFQTAIEGDPDNSDIFHHRGQLNLLLGKIDNAIQDFDRCVALNPSFGVASAQKCYTEYRFAYEKRNPLELQIAVQGFEQTIKMFPNCAEVFALYGQALADQQEFGKADENFKKAARIEPNNANIFVHRGLLCLQWKQDISEASRLINKALEVDDKCEFAYETLGTIEVQRGNLALAIGLFNKAINLAKTEVEMAHLYSLLDAAIAQSKVAKKLGINLPMGM